MSKNEELVEQAKEAIDSVWGDTSVTQHDTIFALQELISHAQVLIDAVYSDLNREASINDAEAHG